MKILNGKDIRRISTTSKFGRGSILICDNEDTMYYLDPTEMLSLIKEREFEVKLKRTRRHLRMMPSVTENRIKVIKAEWDKISKDYKGTNNKKGERSVFGGCIAKGGGTTIYSEGVHFIIVD